LAGARAYELERTVPVRVEELRIERGLVREVGAVQRVLGERARAVVDVEFRDRVTADVRRIRAEQVLIPVAVHIGETYGFRVLVLDRQATRGRIDEAPRAV